MHKQNYQDLLALVQTPTQYLGNEINAVKKDPQQVKMTFALVFPDLYEIGTSHFGLQILYSILNSHANIAAERFFTPAPDMEAYLGEKNIPCLSMESQKELKSFDIIGISLLYELNFTNILTLLSLSQIPFYADQREDIFPLIIGGGPCAFNPEPLADFFDAFVIGDGEETAVQISHQVIEFKKQGDGKKKTLLRLLSKIDGVYVPSFFEPEYDEYGIQTLTPVFEDYKKVKRAFLPDLTRDSFPTSPIIPFAKPVHDRLRLEIARGCSRGCRFCQAGMIYRPVRERSLKDLIKITRTSLKTTGYSDISLLSLSTGDYSNLTQLIEQLLNLGQGHCNAISLPSIRAEKLTPQLMNIIKKVRKTGFTIAPEAGSQRLRDMINKNLTEDSIAATVENALNLGWKNIKLYFMMGLPFETPEDIDAICTLSKRLASAYAKGKKILNVSVASFIPKAHTPFQRCAQISLDETREKLQYLKNNLRHPKVNLKWQSPEMSMIEGVWARGDRKLSKLLTAAFENGCRLDGWTDKFNFSLWQKAFEQTGIDPLFYTTRERKNEEVLPWDHIDSGVLPDFFKKEFQKAKDRSLTPDCRENDCTGCGVCDFKAIKPVLHDIKTDTGKTDQMARIIMKSLPDDAFKKFEITFSKLGPARFFGHLELGTIVQRAVTRAGLNAKYSQGFNPLMRLSFDNALPVGMESEEETLFLYLEKDLSPELIEKQLNKELPQGIHITGCKPYNKFIKKRAQASRYRIGFKDVCIEPEKIDRFLNLSEFMIEDLSKKGKVRKTDLRKSVETISFIDDHTIEMVLKKYNERNVRPTEILTKYFRLEQDVITSARIKKRKQG
ncbi:MAG: TIGR03960 family B12-binding radical SAM protein [Proteobacteria bacterium]|nr:TIGR03960 family B12-binding radical SAM protein [Pseudomonadota bacterium]MBU1581723.1 TIGR03960 family B12-binding radical SAM protein [Pseudomonadota bacterium]MBU2451900.1 TIGR03960 family B12-binding radical SAM protein [Pseudomonadota bacterium]MBU2630434.1 TIGR03960 family B12-binding radical SAM protein [Pseudomonadota bacterium]